MAALFPIPGAPTDYELFSGEGTTIQVNLAAQWELCDIVRSGVTRLRNRGLEVGGLLLGHTGSQIRLESVRDFPIEYQYGPSYRLSSADLEHLESRLLMLAPDPRQRVIGHFRSVTNGDPGVTESDVAISRLLGLHPLVLVIGASLIEAPPARLYRKSGDQFVELVAFSLSPFNPATLAVPPGDAIPELPANLPESTVPVAATTVPAPAIPELSSNLADSALAVDAAISLQPEVPELPAHLPESIVPVGATTVPAPLAPQFQSSLPDSKVPVAATNTLAPVAPEVEVSMCVPAAPESSTILPGSAEPVAATNSLACAVPEFPVSLPGFARGQPRTRSRWPLRAACLAGAALALLGIVRFLVLNRPAAPVSTATRAIGLRVSQPETASPLANNEASRAEPKPEPEIVVTHRGQNEPVAGAIRRLAGPRSDRRPAVAAPYAAKTPQLQEPPPANTGAASVVSSLPAGFVPESPGPIKPLVESVVNYVAPVPIQKSDPIVPIEVRSAMKNSQSVEVKVKIDAQGRVTAASSINAVSLRPGLLDRAAVQAAYFWQFQPARRNGVPVESESILKFDFNLDSGAEHDVAYLAPVPIRKSIPSVPVNLRSLVQNNTSVDVKVRIDEEGRVIASTPVNSVSSLQRLLGPTAAQAAILWRFAPARRNGAPVESESILKFDFQPY
jgi:TonB family protein